MNDPDEPNNGFSVGDLIIIGVGTPFAEQNMVAGFGSIILAYPLKYSHPSGTIVAKYVQATQAPKLCDGDVLGTVLFDDIAALFSLNDAQREAMGENARMEAERLVLEANIPIEVTCERTVTTPQGIFIELIGAPLDATDTSSTATATDLLKAQIDNKLFSLKIVNTATGDVTSLLVPGDFVVDASASPFTALAGASIPMVTYES